MRSKLFTDRKVTQQLSSKFLQYTYNAETKEEKENICQEYAKRMENSYEVVADVITHNTYSTIVCILKNKTNKDSVQRGLKEVQYQLKQEYGDGY